MFVNLAEGTIGGEMEIDAFLKFGYWEPYNGSVTAGELLKIINREKA